MNDSNPAFKEGRPQPLQNPDNLAQVKLPYFDYLLALLKAGDEIIEKSFGRHVHWGYWDIPELATLTTADFEQATENLSKEICRVGKIQNGLKVLDVGCGFGGTIAHINEYYTGMDLTGLNLDERQLERAREGVNPRTDNIIHFEQGNACALPYPDQSFDVVLVVECIFHFPDRKQFFKEAHRVLKPGGYLALSDFIPGTIVLPFTRIKLPERLSVGFYGKCNVQFSAEHYRKLAAQTQFNLQLARDITLNTLPTYTYIRRLGQQRKVSSIFAIIETAAIELLSRLRLIRYFIYAFQKPSL
ncbi:MAG: methyltransferase domain-containing protein [Methylobacter sp.]|nr:methyltransferase domain-containing protein [Methylobacter sp.]